MSTTKRVVGVVAWFNDGKGYGFISHNDRNIFVHYTAIRGEKFPSISEGQSVSFDLIEGPKGPQAANVERI